MLHMATFTGVEPARATFLAVLDTNAEDHRGRIMGRILFFDLRYPDHVGKYPHVSVPFDVAGQFVTEAQPGSIHESGYKLYAPGGRLILWGTDESWAIPASEHHRLSEWVAESYSREGRLVPEVDDF
jgi:hypothetical protein